MVKNSTQEQSCEAVREDEHGIHLLDGQNEQIGYIPYETLNHVVPATDG